MSIIPNLWFDTQAEEAARFYTGIFPRSRILDVVRYGEAGPGPAGTVVTVDFELDGQRFIALNGGPQLTFNGAVSFEISCTSQEEVDHYWAALTAGGQEVRCGWLTDRFGVSWQVVPTVLPALLKDPDPGKADRVTRAMLDMVKLDVEALLRAAQEPAPRPS